MWSVCHGPYVCPNCCYRNLIWPIKTMNILFSYFALCWQLNDIKKDQQRYKNSISYSLCMSNGQTCIQSRRKAVRDQYKDTISRCWSPPILWQVCNNFPVLFIAGEQRALRTAGPVLWAGQEVGHVRWNTSYSSRLPALTHTYTEVRSLNRYWSMYPRPMELL